MLAGAIAAIAKPASSSLFASSGPISLAQAGPQEKPADRPAGEAALPFTRGDLEAAQGVEDALFPLSLGVSYYLLSDYVWRGINLSEYTGEGREKPVHQLTTSLVWDTGEFGQIGFDTFFSWYAAQRQLNPTTGENIQEIDYTIHWSYLVEAIATDVTLGFTFYTFPNLAKPLRQDRQRGNNNDDRTQEWFFNLGHNDAWAWKWLFPGNEDGVLNPNLFFAQDVGIGAGRTWMELGISHEFEVIDNLTITPGTLLAIDGGVLKRYLGKLNANHFRLAYQQFSLDITYDLTELLELPRWAGSVSVSGLLYFNNAMGTARREGSINDEIYGGMSVNWAWGGTK